MGYNRTSETPPFVSIIVPAYNVEDRLTRCLDSLINQTYSHYEIIIVDDGSSDGTRRICETYCGMCSCVRLINKRNGGQSSARNVGLDAASGDYIMFCDSDDFVSCRIVESLVDVALMTGSDIVECTYTICTKDFNRHKKAIDSIEAREYALLVDGRESVLRFVLDYGLVTVALWGKIYAAHLFEGKRFPTELNRYEDDAIMPYLAESAVRYSRINQPLYAYCVRENSVMTSPYSKSDLQLMNVFDERLEYFGVKYGQESAALIKYRYLLAMNEFLAVHAREMDDSDCKVVNRKRYELIGSLNTFPGIQRKVMALFTTFFPRTSHRLRKVKKDRRFAVGMGNASKS